MKKYVLTLFITIIFVSSVIQSQPKLSTTSERLAYAQKNMVVGLRSENSGVVESTMMLVAKMKMKYPLENVSGLFNVIDSLAAVSSSATLRYKAFIVSNMCDDPLWFAHELSLHTLEPDLFYLIAAQRLQRKMLGLSVL